MSWLIMSRVSLKAYKKFHKYNNQNSVFWISIISYYYTYHNVFESNSDLSQFAFKYQCYIVNISKAQQFTEEYDYTE